MKTIQLTRGKVALIDDEDYEAFSAFTWHASTTGWTFYARRNIETASSPQRQRTVRMHRELVGAPRGVVVDHIDGNGLNNQRANLRVASHRQNLNNRGKNANNTSGYKGVSINKKTGLWVAQITEESRRVNLGYFKDPASAARAYDAAARLHHGEFARLNFPQPHERAA